jgi:hypothetical protein
LKDSFQGFSTNFVRKLFNVRSPPMAEISNPVTCDKATLQESKVTGQMQEIQTGEQCKKIAQICYSRRALRQQTNSSKSLPHGTLEDDTVDRRD